MQSYIFPFQTPKTFYSNYLLVWFLIWFPTCSFWFIRGLLTLPLLLSFLLTDCLSAISSEIDCLWYRSPPPVYLAACICPWINSQYEVELITAFMCFACSARVIVHQATENGACDHLVFRLNGHRFNFCTENNVFLFWMSPHTSPLLQLLDVRRFFLLKTAFGKAN